MSSVDLKGSRIVVTGGAGLIGSTLVDYILEREDKPERIIVLDDLSRGTRDNLASALAGGRVELVVGDICDRRLLRSVLASADAVFHQAAIRITRCAVEPRKCVEVMIDGTFNLLEACVEAKVKKVVAASSASIYGEAEVYPTSENHHPYDNRTLYGAAKLANEGMLRSFHEMSGLDYVALRYFNVYGPRMDIYGKYTEVMIRWLECIDRHEAPKIFGDGNQTMDFVFVEDIARANVAAMVSPVTDEVYNIGTGEETSLNELVHQLLKIAGGDGLKPLLAPARGVNDVERRRADCNKARRDLGFSARVGLDEGLSRLVRWRNEALATGGNGHLRASPAD